MEKYTLEQAWNEVEVLDDVELEIGDAATGLFMDAGTPGDADRHAAEYKKAEDLFAAGQYQAVIDHIDGLYGWAPGELDRRPGLSVKETAENCLRLLGH